MDKKTQKTQKTPLEKLNKVLNDQYKEQKNRMGYIGQQLKWPWGPWFVGGTE